MQLLIEKAASHVRRLKEEAGTLSVENCAFERHLCQSWTLLCTVLQCLKRAASYSGWFFTTKHTLETSLSISSMNISAEVRIPHDCSHSKVHTFTSAIRMLKVKTQLYWINNWSFMLAIHQQQCFTFWLYCRSHVSFMFFLCYCRSVWFKCHLKSATLRWMKLSVFSGQIGAHVYGF